MKEKEESIEKILWDVIVIGGGPAGMMAAGRAGERGRRVLLLEKNPGLGKKLLITGGGRCNVTNNKPDVRTMLARYKKSGQFLFSAFTQYGVTETISFFNERGMEIKEENDGRMFPVSNKAQSVWNVLNSYLEKNNVRVRTMTGVLGITYDEAKEQMVVTLIDKSIVRAKTCIVATGGTSRPQTGSTGEGFGWLKKNGTYHY
jgi:predicted Rossmann fold flavoprotein